MDFRTTKEIFRWLEERKLMNNCDEVSLAGASKELVDGNEAVQELIFKQIAISAGLHQAETVILLHHSDCGAYSAYQFADAEAEKAKQLEDMAKAAALIKARFPEMVVRKVWAKLLDDHGSKIEFLEI